MNVNYYTTDDIAPMPELHPDDFKSTADLKVVLKDITDDIDTLDGKI